MKICDLENYSITLFNVKDQLMHHVYSRTVNACTEGDLARDAVQSKEQLEERQTYMRSKFIEAIGGLPPCDTPLNPRITDILECDGYKIEKIIFESRPHDYVTSNLYIPDGIDTPNGAVVFVCGHYNDAKHHPEYQTVCQYLTRAGLIVFAIDPIGQGERSSYYDPSAGRTVVDMGVEEHDLAGNQCWPLGYGIACFFVHDIIRAIDYLSARSEVDPAKIGITGNSGGGTQTSMAMICDKRLAAAVPATFIMNRATYLFSGQNQDSEQIWPGMTALGFDHEDILLAMAPRPVQVLAVTEDFFPIESTRKTVERTRRFWDMYGRTGFPELVEDVSNHKYTVPLAKAAAVFFAKQLLGKDVSVENAQIQPLEPSRLWCTVNGQVRGDFSDSRAVHEQNCDRLNRLEQERLKMPEEIRKERAMVWLREKVLVSRQVQELNPRYLMTTHVNELNVQSIMWKSQKDLFNHAFVFRDFRYQEKRLPVTVALWEGGTKQLQSHLPWIRSTCSQGRAVMVLDVTGIGALSPNSINQHGLLEFRGTMFKLTWDLFWLGDSLAAIRIFDIIRALDMAKVLKEGDPDDVRIYTHGRYGIYAELAAHLDERARRLEMEQGPGHVADWVRERFYNTFDVAGLIVPGMLQYLDLSNSRA